MKDLAKENEDLKRLLYHIVTRYEHLRQPIVYPRPRKFHRAVRLSRDNELMDSTISESKKYLKSHDWWPTEEPMDKTLKQRNINIILAGLLAILIILILLAGSVVLASAKADSLPCDHCGAGIWYEPGGSYSIDDAYGAPNHLLPTWAMTSFQQRLYDARYLSYYSWVTENGRLGPETKQAVERFQAHVGLPVNGRIGPRTSRALFRPVVDFMDAGLGIPSHLLYGVVALESDFDPGAQGINDPQDRGILQYNANAYPSISDVEAYAYASDRIEQAAWHIKGVYDALAPYEVPSHLRWLMATVGHFSVVDATKWAACYHLTGKAITKTCSNGAALYYGGTVSRLAKEYPG